mmetsp:Transcript_113989/g.329281  ORF Transcript_113989/g.329281 Transcript_113989/m.329281 type:complete len:238 (-) Transcript_113989:850-1563(-)
MYFNAPDKWSTQSTRWPNSTASTGVVPTLPSVLTNTPPGKQSPPLHEVASSSSGGASPDCLAARTVHSMIGGALHNDAEHPWISPAAAGNEVSPLTSDASAIVWASGATALGGRLERSGKRDGDSPTEGDSSHASSGAAMPGSTSSPMNNRTPWLLIGPSVGTAMPLIVTSMPGAVASAPASLESDAWILRAEVHRETSWRKDAARSFSQHPFAKSVSMRPTSPRASARWPSNMESN